MTSLDGETHEIEMKNAIIKVKDPIQIAFSVYADAKISILSFVYDFLDHYFPRSAYELICTDTDSIYFAYAESKTNSLESLIKPELRESYFRNRGKFLPSQVCEKGECVELYVAAKTHEYEWVQPLCCHNAEMFQNRTPGLFKTEYEGDEICFLALKTYCAENDWENLGESYSRNTKQKISCKGVNKGINPLKMEDFKKVLFEGQKKEVLNRGFRFDGTMRTYEQRKSGLSPIFIKRRVLHDCVHTENAFNKNRSIFVGH